MGHRDRGDIDRIRKISISPISQSFVFSTIVTGILGEVRVKPDKHGQKQRDLFLCYKGYNHNTLLLFKKRPRFQGRGEPPCLSLLDVKRESSVIQMPSNSEDYPSFHSSFSIREPE